MVAQTVFHRVGVVGMRRAEEVAHIIVVGGVLVGILDNETYGLACGKSFENARKDFHAVFLIAGSDYRRLPGTAAIEFMLYFIYIEGYAGGYAVNDTAHCCTV